MVSALTVRKHHGLNLSNFKCQAVPTFSPQPNLKTQYTLRIATAVIMMGVKYMFAQGMMFNPGCTASVFKVYFLCSSDPFQHECPCNSKLLKRLKYVSHLVLVLSPEVPRP